MKKYYIKTGKIFFKHKHIYVYVLPQFQKIFKRHFKRFITSMKLFKEKFNDTCLNAYIYLRIAPVPRHRFQDVFWCWCATLSADPPANLSRGVKSVHVYTFDAM